MERERWTLRLPPDLAEQAAWLAQHQGLTANAFVVAALRNWVSYQAKRAGLVPKATPTPAAPVKGVRTPPATDSDPDDEPLPGLEPGPAPAVRSVPKVGANQPCPCGSGQKYKRCHGKP